MECLLVRHGPSMDREAFAEETGKDDRYRPLSTEGKQEMRENVRGIRELVADLDAIVTSPLTRAVQTANILNDGYDEDIKQKETSSLEPGRSPTKFVEWGTSNDLGSSVALTGHKPNLNRVATYLLTGSNDPDVVHLSKGSAMKLELDSNVQSGSALLKWYLLPNQLRHFGRS